MFQLVRTSVCVEAMSLDLGEEAMETVLSYLLVSYTFVNRELPDADHQLCSTALN